MKNAKKAMLLVLCAVLLVAGSVMGTMAYLTSKSEVVENTFTVGNVKITLDEAKVDEYGVAEEDAARVTANKYKLIPGHEYTKDPTVHVIKGSEECWLFVKVVNGISDIEADTSTIAAQMAANDWTPVAGETNVYAYANKVDARDAAVDVHVFGTFTVDGEAAVANFEGASITVTAYAVQADGFASAAAAWAEAPASW